MSDMFLGSQTPLYQNVTIKRRSKTGKILEERHAKNRVTRLMLYGIGKFLLGHFNNSSPDKIYEHIPRYLALGTNVAPLDETNVGVGINSTVNDTRLLNEIKYATVKGGTETVNRIWIAERNMCKLNTKFSDPFIKLTIKTYVSSYQYDGVTIGEAGLFSKEQNNNCLARVCFAPITKNPGEVLDIQWDITLLSYGETKYAEKLEIENGYDIVIPLTYTNKVFKTIGLKTYIFKENNTIGTSEQELYFKYDTNGVITPLVSDAYFPGTTLYSRLKYYDVSDSFDSILEQIKTSKLNDVSNPFYLISNNQKVPCIIHIGPLYDYDDIEDIEENELAMTLLYDEDIHEEYIETGWTYQYDGGLNEYKIYSPQFDTDKYKLLNNEFFIKEDDKWITTNTFLYNTMVINLDKERLEYSLRDGNIYKVKITNEKIFTNQYLNYSDIIDEKTLLPDEKLHLYSIEKHNTLIRTGWTVDTKDYMKLYKDGEYAEYHISRDNYWIMSNYSKLIPVITPKDATDKSITWIIQNTDIATINWDGVVTGWNIGETTAIASTTNGIKTKVRVRVIKETSYIDISNIEVTPNEIILIVDGDENQNFTLKANVSPLIATNPTVKWSASYEIANCISLIDLGDNKARVMLSGNGSTGSGEIIATSHTGLTAKCKVTVLFSNANNTCDCDDPSHLLQEG